MKFEQALYKKVDGTVIRDVKEYVKEFLETNPTTQIHIGCDSQAAGRNEVHYAISVCLYIPGNGGHVINKKLKLEKNLSRDGKVSYEKLWNEVELAVAAAEELSEVIDAHELTIHIDYNVKATAGSHDLYDAGMGYVSSLGYKALGKPSAWAASKVADKYCRH